LQEAESKERIWKSHSAHPVANLDVLPSGQSPNPPSCSRREIGKMLLGGKRYDRILSAPPILAVSDCALIGRVFDGAFWLIRADKNDRIMPAAPATPCAV